MNFKGDLYTIFNLIQDIIVMSHNTIYIYIYTDIIVIIRYSSLITMLQFPNPRGMLQLAVARSQRSNTDPWGESCLRRMVSHSTQSHIVAYCLVTAFR